MQALGGKPHTNFNPELWGGSLRSPASAQLHGSWQELCCGLLQSQIFLPWDMRSSKALLKTSWNSTTTSHVKNWGSVPQPTHPHLLHSIRKLFALFVIHPNILFRENMSLVKHLSQKKKQKKTNGVNLGTTFPLRWQSLLGKIWEHVSWLGKTLTSVMCDVRVGKGNTQLKYHCY